MSSSSPPLTGFGRTTTPLAQRSPSTRSTTIIPDRAPQRVNVPATLARRATERPFPADGAGSDAKKGHGIVMGTKYVPVCVTCHLTIGGEGKRKKGYCGECVQKGLRSHAEATKILTAQLLATRTRSHAILHPLKPPHDIDPTSNTSRPSSGRRSSSRTTQASSNPLSPHGHLADLALLATVHDLLENTRAVKSEVSRVRGGNGAKVGDLRGRRDEVLKRRANLVLGRGKIVQGLALKTGSGTRISSTAQGKGGSAAASTGNDRQPEVERKRPSPSARQVDYLDTTPHLELSRTRKENEDIQARLVHARRVLVREVVEVMGIRLDTGSARMGRQGLPESANGRGQEMEIGHDQWEIASLPFLLPRNRDPGSSSQNAGSRLTTSTIRPTRDPTSAPNRSSPSAQSTNVAKTSSTQALPTHYHNALLGHVVHALTLITSYLDIELPFEMTWRDASGSAGAAALSGAFARGQVVAKEGRSDEVDKSDRPSGKTHPAESASKPHVGKIYLSTRNTLPFIIPAPSPYLNLLTSANRQRARERDKAEEAMFRKEGVLYVSTAREKWRKRLQGVGRGTESTGGTIGRSVSKATSQGIAQREATSAAPTVDSATSSTATTSALTFGSGRDRHQEKENQLVLAYTMLAMNVAYLAQTQGVDLGLAVQAGVDGGSSGGSENRAAAKASGNVRQMLSGAAAEKAYAYALEDVGSILKHIAALADSPGLGLISHLPSSSQIRSIAPPINFTDLHDQMQRAFSGLPVLEGENIEGSHTTAGMGESGGVVVVVEEEEWDMV